MTCSFTVYGRGSGMSTTVLFSVDVTVNLVELHLGHLSMMWVMGLPVGLKIWVTPSWPSFLPGFLIVEPSSLRLSSLLLLFISLYSSEFLEGGELEFS